MSDRQNHRFAKPSGSLSSSLNTMCTSWELPHIIFFATQLILKLNIVKNFIVIYVKLVCIIKLWLIRGYQPFTNCSVGLQLDPPNVRSTKSSVRKAIWQSEKFLDYAMYRVSAPTLKIFSKWIIFQIRHCEKVHCPLSKASLHSLIAFWPKASRRSSTVQLDFSWTLEMSDRQNDWFARPSDSLKSSLATLYTS